MARAPGTKAAHHLFSFFFERHGCLASIDSSTSYSRLSTLSFRHFFFLSFDVTSSLRSTCLTLINTPVRPQSALRLLNKLYCWYVSKLIPIWTTSKGCEFYGDFPSSFVRERASFMSRLIRCFSLRLFFKETEQPQSEWETESRWRATRPLRTPLAYIWFFQSLLRQQHTRNKTKQNMKTKQKKKFNLILFSLMLFYVGFYFQEKVVLKGNLFLRLWQVSLGSWPANWAKSTLSRLLCNSTNDSKSLYVQCSETGVLSHPRFLTIDIAYVDVDVAAS